MEASSSFPEVPNMAAFAGMYKTGNDAYLLLSSGSTLVSVVFFARHVTFPVHVWVPNQNVIGGRRLPVRDDRGGDRFSVQNCSNFEVKSEKHKVVFVVLLPSLSLLFLHLVSKTGC